MRLYRARVRYWPYEGSTRGMHECKILLQAEDIDSAFREAAEIALQKVWFGWDPKAVQTMEAASVELPCVL